MLISTVTQATRVFPPINGNPGSVLGGNRQQGEARPKALGGDRRSKLIEVCHDAVMSALGPD